jgi:hypothetical protein
MYERDKVLRMHQSYMSKAFGNLEDIQHDSGRTMTRVTMVTIYLMIYEIRPKVVIHTIRLMTFLLGIDC